jgi:hypothetical protein
VDVVCDCPDLPGFFTVVELPVELAELVEELFCVVDDCDAALPEADVVPLVDCVADGAGVLGAGVAGAGVGGVGATVLISFCSILLNEEPEEEAEFACDELLPN